ncbi:MAG: hypothetical protein WAU54_01605 [Chania sp.]
MQKIGNITETADKNGEFTNGNIAQGIQPTLLLAEIFNTWQRELVNIVEGSGIDLDPKDDGQLLKAIFMNITNLGLKSAAKRDVGGGVNQIPDMSFFTFGNGWTKYPSGVIHQYGLSGPIAPNGTQTITFPIPFPTGVLGASLGVYGATAGTAEYTSITRTSITLANGLAGSATNPIFYFAVGN